MVGRIAPEEPRDNASLLAALYANDERRGRPRALDREDLEPQVSRVSGGVARRAQSAPLLDAEGNRYAIASVTDGPSSELRWTRVAGERADAARTVSLRATVGALETYEPPLTLTALAVATAGPDMSGATLGAELGRMRRSPIVLNRGLREAVARRVGEGATLSEIALRCGRLKRDRRGNVSGETSWLARRIGQLPESGQPRPTPWIHSNTLALIARQGLSMGPHEVEL
jgi:hypothetical protein